MAATVRRNESTLLRALLDALEQPVLVLEPVEVDGEIGDLRIVDRNEAHRRLVGDPYRIGMLASDCFVRPELAIAAARAVLRGERVDSYLVTTWDDDRREAGTVFEVTTSATPDGLVVQTSVDRSIGLELVAALDRERVILDTVSQGVFVWDPIHLDGRLVDARLRYVNPAGLLRFDDPHGVVGRTMRELFPMSAEPALAQCDITLRTGRPRRRTVKVIEHATAGVSPELVELEFRPIGDQLLIVESDRTESIRQQRALEATTSLVEALLDTATDGYFVHDTAGVVVWANKIVRHHWPELRLGPEGTRIDADPVPFVSPAGDLVPRRVRRDLIADGPARYDDVSTRVILPSGEVRDVAVATRPITTDDGGQATLVRLSFEQRSVRESEADAPVSGDGGRVPATTVEASVVLERLPTGVAVFEPSLDDAELIDATAIYVNPALSAMCGADAAAADLARLLERTPLLTWMRAAWRDRTTVVGGIDNRAGWADPLVPGEYEFTVAAADDVVVVGIVDRTHERASDRRIATTLERLHHVRESERQSIAVALHDGAIQSLVAARLHLSALVSATHEQSTRSGMISARDALDAAVDELRTHTFELFPPSLARSGLIAALVERVERQRPAQPVTRVVDRIGGRRFAPAVERLVFRTVQELLRNAERHARAASVEVGADIVDETLVVEVRDDGCGFDPSAVGDDRFGLQSCRELVHLAGGRIDVASAPGRGTVVTVSIPT